MRNVSMLQRSAICGANPSSHSSSQRGTEQRRRDGRATDSRMSNVVYGKSRKQRGINNLFNKTYRSGDGRCIGDLASAADCAVGSPH
jgi:hypothetical protein